MKKNLVCIDCLKRYSFFKHKNEILQLVDIDFLDEWADVYNVKTQEIKTLELSIYVKPVNVKIVESRTGAMTPVVNLY